VVGPRPFQTSTALRPNPFLVDNSNDGPNTIARRNFQYHPQSLTVRLMDRMVEMSAFLNVTGLKTAKVYRVRPIQVHTVR